MLAALEKDEKERALAVVKAFARSFSGGKEGIPPFYFCLGASMLRALISLSSLKHERVMWLGIWAFSHPYNHSETDSVTTT